MPFTIVTLDLPLSDGQALASSLSKPEEEKIAVESFSGQISHPSPQLEEQNGILCLGSFRQTLTVSSFGGLSASEFASKFLQYTKNKNIRSNHLYLLSGLLDLYPFESAMTFAQLLAIELNTLGLGHMQVHAFDDSYAHHGHAHYVEVVTNPIPRDGEIEAQMGDLIAFKTRPQIFPEVAELKTNLAQAYSREEKDEIEGRLFHKFHQSRLWGKKDRLGPVPVLDFLNFPENTFIDETPLQREARIKSHPSYIDRQERKEVIKAIQEQLKAQDESVNEDQLNWLSGLATELKRLVIKTWRAVCADYVEKNKAKKPYVTAFDYSNSGIHLISQSTGQQVLSHREDNNVQVPPQDVNDNEVEQDLLPRLKLVINDLKTKLQDEIRVLDARANTFGLSFFLSLPTSFEKRTKLDKIICLSLLLQADNINALQNAAIDLVVPDPNDRVNRGFINTVTWAWGVSRTTNLMNRIVTDPQGLVDEFELNNQHPVAMAP